MARPNPKRFARRYPWNKWFKQRRFTLRRGKDYEYRTYIMAQMVRNAASKKRLSITIGVSEDEQSIHVTVNGRKDSCEYYRRTGRYEGGLVGSM